MSTVISVMLRTRFPPDADWIVTDVVLRRDRRIGSGAFGEVFEAIWKGNLVAAKKLHDIFFQANVVPEEQCRRMIMEFVAECALQAMLRHPNIVPLFGVFLPPGGRDGEQAPVMISELMAETLRGRVLRAPRLTIRDIVDVALQIASALRFLHERPEPIAHRDLSANNVMLSFGGKCKIGDLGLAKVFTNTQQLATTRKPGTEPYMPGEVLQAPAGYNEKLDNFSLGVLILEMANGREPQPSAQFAEEEELNGRILHALIPETRRRQNDLEELGRQHVLRPLIERLLEPQASRPTIGEVYQGLEDLCSSRDYTDSPSTLGNMEDVTARLAGELRRVEQAVQQLHQRQTAFEENTQQAEEALRRGHGEVRDDVRAVREDVMRLSAAQQEVQQVIHEERPQLRQQQVEIRLGLQQLQTDNQHLRQGQQQLHESVLGLAESQQRLQDQLTRSLAQTDATMVCQQQAINAVEQHVDTLRRDVESSHGHLEQRMNTIAGELLAAINEVAESLRRRSSAQIEVRNFQEHN